MPNIMEISGLLSGRMGRLRRHRKMGALMDLRNALGAGKKGKKSRKHRSRKVGHSAAVKHGSKGVRALPGPNAGRALEVAEKMLAEGKKPLAIAWARQAEIKGRAEGRSAIVRRAQEIIKAVRGEAVLKTAAGFGDIEMIYMGRHLGLW